NANLLQWGIAGQPDLAKQLESEQGKNYHPKRNVNNAVDQTPLAGLVGDAEKLQGEGHLQESEGDFDGIQPAARFRQTLDEFGKHGEKSKRQREREGVKEHHGDGLDDLAPCRKEKHAPNNRHSAAERDQYERRGHKKYAGEPTLFRLLIGLIDQLVRCRDLKQ